MNSKQTSEKFLSFKKKGIPQAIIGLPYAGKTTFVNRLLTGEFSQPRPTMGMDFESYNVFDTKINIFDLGGHKSFRDTIWENYIKLSYGFIFVIDSANKENIAEAKKEFWKSVELKNTGDEFLILFLCNKADLEDSLSLEYIINELELYKLAELAQVSFQFFKTSMKTGQNFEHVMYWLKNQITKIIKQRKITPISFLFADRNGLPIITITKQEIDQESSLQSGFLSAIDSFAKKAFKEAGVLQFLMSNQYKYIIYATEDYIFSTIIESSESHEEARRIIDIISQQVEKIGPDFVKIEKFVIDALSINLSEYKLERGYK